jgi:hypothetical protein
MIEDSFRLTLLRVDACQSCFHLNMMVLPQRINRRGPTWDGDPPFSRGAFDSRAFFQLDAFKPDKTLPCGPK